MRALLVSLALAIAAPGLAQEAPPPPDPTGRPLSAIDWLSESVRAPDPLAIGQGRGRVTTGIDEAPVATDATAPQVTVMPLGAASPDPIGLLPSSVTGLPRTLWAGSDETVVATLIAAELIETLPAMRDLMRMLLLAEADPPRTAGPDGTLFLARIDKLLDLGALDPAWEMLDASDPDSPPLFRRYLDVALLTGRETRACRLMDERPELAPTLSARIFCLAHIGDWPAAALTLNTARVLGDVSPAEEALLARFLDPELFQGLPPLTVPERPTPLGFRLREGIGESLSTVGLPRAFAHADLRPITGWKARLEAAERLARVGAIDDTVLLDLYTLRQPAASGSVWDRAEAIQAFDDALQTGRAEDVAAALGPAWDAMKAARTETAFARLFAAELAALPLEGRAEGLAYRIGLLSDSYEEIALDHTPANAEEAMLAQIALGQPPEPAPQSQPALAIHTALAGAPPPERLAGMVAEDRLGEAILRAIALFDSGVAGDPGALTEALAFFRAVGLEDTARRAALQLIILERAP
ncbi:hypothetical protein [Roseisalinus antarcticus]|uniref:Antifreeze glycopeptide polyprotein n=1 Tax=Roseisalinus antarcticus TaxID=254357 RepID=A0A1Y5RFX9_9RHOB|nr:hypothetical protein [Roseisalinus antarcticus]SLN15691.1 hypothetical protein ROA7023_00216 [Roseisalinus antarcticus]